MDVVDEPGTGSRRDGSTWNHPRINIFRTLAAIWSFVVIGINNGSYGALISYIREYYQLSYTVVALIFLPGLIGSFVAVSSNDAIHHVYGQRGIAMGAGCCQLLAYIIISFHPPFFVVILCMCIWGFGASLYDGAWNAFLGDMDHASELLGLLHGMYGLGSIIGPLAVTVIVTKAQLPWYSFFYFLIPVSTLTVVITTLAFWHSDGPTFRATRLSDVSDGEDTQDDGKSRFRNLLTTSHHRRVVLISLLLLLLQGGLEFSTSGWIVVFMLRIRHATPFASGMVDTGFWAGFTLGRITLGFVTPRLGTRRAITAYLLLAFALELIFWYVPHFYVSAIAVALQGVFLGPIFPAGMLVLARLLPKHLHVTVLSLASFSGSIGSTIFPFGVGALAESIGIQALVPVVLGLLVAEVGLWVSLPLLDEGQKKRNVNAAESESLLGSG